MKVQNRLYISGQIAAAVAHPGMSASLTECCDAVQGGAACRAIDCELQATDAKRPFDDSIQFHWFLRCSIPSGQWTPLAPL